MKKHYALISFWLLSYTVSVAQPYGNEWIKFSTNQPYSDQQYFKVSVWREGIYRITYADLQAASFPMPFNPKQLQLFNLGQEQYIYVEGETDGSFDPNDYIEFYGKKNDGTFDTRLYKNPNHQLNKAYSLCTDTASYFLTLNINPFANNRRIVQESDVNYLGYSSIPYFMTESFKDFHEEYNAYRFVDIKDAEYDEGEGWTSQPLGTLPLTQTLPVPNISTDPSAPIGIVSTTIMGGNSTGSPHDITLNVHGASASSTFWDFQVTKFTFPLLSNSSIPGSTALFQFSLGSGLNKTHVSFIKLFYPHTLTFAGQSSNFLNFTVPGNLATGKSYLDIATLNMTNPRLYMFSGDSLKRVAITVNGNNVQALIPTFGFDKNCFFTDSIYTTTSGHMRISTVNDDPATFAKFTNFHFISSADYLIVAHKSLWNKANAYKNYRAQTGYTPLLADVEELYNQFAYGITKHPLSIKNFCAFALDTFTLKPDYLLLIGKSVTPIETRLTGANNVPVTTSHWNKNLVPTFGYPSSDILLVSGIHDTLPRPEIAVGRISASTEDDVQAYLDKIISHDLQLTQCPQEWMKQVLHFGGGNSGYQSDYIREILKGLENIVEDTLMGANVHTFLKTSSDPIQVNLSQYLQALIDSGTTMMTFVAHASGSSFDISTDLPQNYHNKDRYPLILANSCFVGDIHDPLRRIAEDFVLLPEKGAIAFVAQPDVGYLDNLKMYSMLFYNQVANFNYGGKVGQTMQIVIDSLLASPDVTNNNLSYFVYKSIITGMTLSGDPALVLNSFAKPEYEISPGSVYFTPTVITSDLDSFNVHVILKNLGRATYDPFILHLVRNFPDGGPIFEMDTIINYVAYKDTIVIRLPLNPERGIGPNTFEVYADYAGNIFECNEGNNTIPPVPLLIQSSDIVPVYPSEFAIVPSNTNFKLKASTVNPFATLKPYNFQIDTIDSFNSPFMVQTVINSVGGVVQWQVPFSLIEDKVYYWRVSRDSMATDTIHPTWKESSFIYKQGITGWSQAHYSQFKKDEFTNIDYVNSYDTTFSFVSSYSSLLVRNYQTPTLFENPYYEINNTVMDYQMCSGLPSMHIVVIDSVSLKPWATDQYFFGNANTYNPQTHTGSCRNRPENYFIFRMNDPVSKAAMFSMLQNIPNGNHVVAYSVFSGWLTSWNQAEKDVFNAMGADSINYINATQPYIFYTKKGDNSTTLESIGDSVETMISLSTFMGGNWSKGFVNSVPIGPATQWTALHWDQSPFETTSGADSITIDIIGITPFGTEVPITGFTGIQVGNYDLSISSIDATQYPKIKLRAYKQDEVLYTPPQLKRWQIYYNEIPELALNPAKYFKLNKDTLAEGEEIKMEMAVENIGNVNSDSVLVDFYILDKNRVRHNVTSPRYKETAPGDTITATVSLSTTGYDGLNSLWIDANPNQDQPEQTHFNNIAEIKFLVDKDITNPILDVTFDGVHIMNGDIVSGKPEIQIRLKDENPYLALNDTSDWQVFIREPNGQQTKLSFETVECSGVAKDVLKWCPAQLPNNLFRIQYNPILLKDGIYELWVQASDISGNISGANNYRITFEVINKATITEVVNYPNPFSTSTRFVFTLTGSEVPEDFKIQIMTVSGKVIREINKDELGPIRIGRNITEFAWNGKDEFGDQLANGVYLYRVLTRLNGAGIEKRETEADKFFTKGWGKMYLMR